MFGNGLLLTFPEESSGCLRLSRCRLVGISVPPKVIFKSPVRRFKQSSPVSFSHNVYEFRTASAAVIRPIVLEIDHDGATRQMLTNSTVCVSPLS